MNKKIILLLIFFLTINCSFNSQSKFWTKETKIKVEKNSNINEIFKKDKIFEKELNPSLKIKLSDKLIENSFIGNLDNNNGRTNYNGNLKKSSRFKFSRIDNFDFTEPELSLIHI